MIVVAATIACSADRVALAAKPDDPRVLAAIDRGSQYLKTAALTSDGGRAGIAALGLMKSGTSPDDPAIQKIIETKLLPKFQQDGTYKPAASQTLYYEAGVDLMVYGNSHSKAYDKEIKTLANILLDGQHAEGCWTYPERTVTENDRGDTSITQYALLGLWEAERYGMAVPPGVWDKAAAWLVSNQDSEGGFWYHPGSGSRPTPSIVAAGTSNLLVCRLMLGSGEFGSARRKGQGQARFGVLKKINLDSPAPVQGKRRRAPAGPVRMSRPAMDRSAQRGLEWLDHNWIGAEPTYFQYYYYYALERACALAGADRIGEHDWYDEISDGVLKQQRPNGSWNGTSQSGPVPDTAFALLFLSRATAKLMRHHPDEQLFGGGLMIGGRGLPTNLSAVQSGAEGIQVRKLEAPVDQLLSELENPKSTKVEAAQQAIVERVELGDRETLIGQRDRLLHLARDSRVEVRRTAIWALGRCATIHEARVLVKALDDPELSVVVEANNALCWFSRRPNGFGRPADPLAELPDNATERQKEEAAKSWRARVRADWRGWFENVRPYSERSLPIDLP